MDFFKDNGFQRSSHFRIFFISLLAAVIGILAGVVAYALYSLIALITNLVFFQRIGFTLPSMQTNNLRILLVVVPAIGGLIVGIMAKYGSPKIKGHGIPEAMEAVALYESRIEPRVGILKPVSAAIAIGTGSPFGAEGPIIQTGGALGSLIGQILHTTAAERKVLLACGAAAGMSATFSTPIAGVILAIELLLFEFKSRSFIPLVISSTLATVMHFQLMGSGPMFVVAPTNFNIVAGLPFYAILGVICGLAAAVFSKGLYWVEDQYERLPLDPLWWPAIGGVFLGVIGLFVPRVLGVGYDTITAILNNHLGLSLLLALVLFKSLALIVTLGSGTSGGLLAPMFTVGAALGGAYAILINAVFQGANLAPGAFALVAMAALFGAASRATFTFIIFAFEITRDYNSILPLLLVSVIADGVAITLMRHSIMTEKLERRGIHIPEGYEANIFEQAHVGQVMEADPVTFPASMQVSELADLIAHRDPRATRHQAFLLVDSQGKLSGIITFGDVFRSLDQQPDGKMTLLQAGHSNLVTTFPDELLADAIDKMLHYEVGRLPVVDRQNPRHIVGYLGRSALLKAQQRRLKAESEREAGWLAHFHAPHRSRHPGNRRPPKTPGQAQVPK